MAQMTLYTPEQVAERSRPKREQKRAARERAIAQYHEYLLNAGPGYAGEVFLEEGEDKRKERLFLKEAADRAGLNLKFRPIKDKGRIEFLVEPNGAQRGRRAKKAQDNDQPRRRPGRPRKSAS